MEVVIPFSTSTLFLQLLQLDFPYSFLLTPYSFAAHALRGGHLRADAHF